MTNQQRKALQQFKTNMRRIATAVSNNLIGLKSLGDGETDPQARAAYQTAIKMTPALVTECRALAAEVEIDLRNDRLREGDAWQSLLNRSRLVSFKFAALHEELYGEHSDAS